MQCWDSNPRPSEFESLPITTRPGLATFYFILIEVSQFNFDHPLFVEEQDSKFGPLPRIFEGVVSLRRKTFCTNLSLFLQ